MTDSIVVVRRPETVLVGMVVRTDMQRAMFDCPKLWNDVFGPRMHEACGGICAAESYGVSWAVNETECIFDYWAAVPARQGVLPEGMAETTLPDGLYAELAVPSLEKLQEAYTTIWEKWLPAQEDYEADHTAPSYELYPSDYMETGRFRLYFPVKPVSRYASPGK